MAIYEGFQEQASSVIEQYVAECNRASNGQCNHDASSCYSTCQREERKRREEHREERVVIEIEEK